MPLDTRTGPTSYEARYPSGRLRMHPISSWHRLLGPLVLWTSAHVSGAQIAVPCCEKATDHCATTWHCLFCQACKANTTSLEFLILSSRLARCVDVVCCDGLNDLNHLVS